MSLTAEDRALAIAKLVNPRSIAIVGASIDLAKINGRPLKHLLDKGFAGRILPVNAKYAEISGLRCYPAIEALPEAADMAVVAVSAREVAGSITALGRRGVRAAVVFSSGFGEMGQAGRALEAELMHCARAAGVMVCGPNCLGLVNAFENVYATFSQYADGDTGAGPIAFVTQSGAFGTAIAALIRQRGLGLGYFINTGNEADLEFSELMSAVIDDPRIKVAAGYLEGVRDGAALVRLAERCRALGKPLVLTKVGRMAAGARAAASHTGALAVEDHVFDAVIRQFGVIRARNEEQMLDILEVLANGRRAAGRGLGIATQSGGAGVMMADRAEELGLEVPALGQATRQRLDAVMPAFGASGNPVDVTGQFVAKPELLREAVIALMDDPQVDVGIVWLQLMTSHVETLLRIFIEIRDRTTKPFLVCWVAAPIEAIRLLRAEGIVVYPAGERTVEAAAALLRHGNDRLRTTAGQAPPATLRYPLPNATGSGVQPTVLACEWLRSAGIPMARVGLAHSAAEAVALWQDIGAPVAMKIESLDITHKTEIGGVLLGRDSEASVAEGFRTLMQRIGKSAPGARLDGVIVQAMSEGHVELVIGVKRDPVFGAVVMVGLGGIFVEVLRDVVFRRAPFDEQEGLRMLSELRTTRVLDGVRGRPGVDRAAIARLLARRWAAACRPVSRSWTSIPCSWALTGRWRSTASWCSNSATSRTEHSIEDRRVRRQPLMETIMFPSGIRHLRIAIRIPLLGMVAAALCSTPARAQGNYPNHSINLIAPYSAGGDADAAARNFAAIASKLLGQSIVVLNRTGASGTIGSASVINSAPDGYTLLLARTGSQSIMPAMMPKMSKYKWDDYTFIGTLETNPYGCVVNAKSPYQTFPELVKALKSSGRGMNNGTAGVMTTNDLGPRLLFRLLDLKDQTPTQVPYKGTGEASASLLGGVTDFACGSLGSFLALAKAGQLRVLMTTTPKRIPALPDVPTARELGYADMEGVIGWSALFGPPGMSVDVRDKLAVTVKAVTEDPAWIAATAVTGSIPAYRSPEETKEYMHSQFDLYRSLGESLNIVDSKP